jgi:hypothetical protein
MGEDVNLTRHRHLHNEFFRLIDQIREIGGGVGKAGIEILKPAGVVLIDKNAVEDRQKVIACCAVGRPLAREGFPGP